MEDWHLDGLIGSADPERLLAFFRDMPEKQRRSLADPLRKAFKRLHARDLHCAVVATASFTELKSVLGDLRFDDTVYQALLDRRPTWLHKLPDALLSQRWPDWATVRRLVRDGHVPRPDHPNYALGMLSLGGCDSNLYDDLLADPGLLEREIWGLFVHEGSGDTSLANCDRWGPSSWSATLKRLSEEERIDRQRLLSACLEALSRDFNHYRARWFFEFFDDLEPTEAELLGSRDAFPGLLRMTAPNVVSWAFKKVTQLHRRQPYAPSVLIGAMEPIMGARAKGLVVRALKLVGKTAKAHPDTARQACDVAMLALSHAHQDAQSQALTLLETHWDRCDAESRDTLAAHRDLVVPTLWPRVDSLSGASADGPSPQIDEEVPSIPAWLAEMYRLDDLTGQPGPEGWAVEAAVFDGTELPRLATVERLEPIRGMGELFEVAARVIADATGPDDMERCLEAVCRLCGEDLEPWRGHAAPLLKQAQRVLKKQTPFVGDAPAADLAGVILAWLLASKPEQSVRRGEHPAYVRVELAGVIHEQFAGNVGTSIGLLGRRCSRVATRAATGSPRVLLSAPTHQGGWIDPALLARRIANWSGDPPHAEDLSLALLRCAPERRQEAIAVLPGANSEWLAAARYGLGGDPPALDDIRDGALWVCAARARAPWAPDPVLQQLDYSGPDAARPADYAYRLRLDSKWNQTHIQFPGEVMEAEPRGLPQLFHQERGHYMWELGSIGGRTEAGVRWVQTLWPLARESVFAASAETIARNLDWWEAQWQNKVLLEGLLDRGTPLRQMGLLLLGLGLVSKEPGEHLLAVDAAIRAIEEGRLGSDNLGEILGTLVLAEGVKLGRAAKTLTLVAAASDGHAAVVKLALEPAIAAALPHAPRDLGKLMTLLQQLSVQLGCGLSAVHADAFASTKGNGKLARSARTLAKGAGHLEGNTMAHAVHQLAVSRAHGARVWAS